MPTIISPGVLVDGGGFIITIGPDGKIHIEKVPPWGPDTYRALQKATAILQHASVVEKEGVASLIKSAEAVLAPVSKDLANHLKL